MDKDGLFELYLNKLKFSNKKAYLLASFYWELMGFSPEKSDIAQFGLLAKLYGSVNVLLAISRLAFVDKLSGRGIGLLRYFLDEMMVEKAKELNMLSANLTDTVIERRKELAKRKKRTLNLEPPLNLIEESEILNG